MLNMGTMSGNSFGKIFSVRSFGESHGPAMGVVIEGMPAGVAISREELQNWVNRRSPGKLKGTSARNEPDQVEILSGIYQDKTLGTPIALIVKNLNQKSEDYDQLKNTYRPGHADKTTMQKYGIRDPRGGGRSSGRETISRVMSGYFASLILPKIKIQAVITKLGPFSEKHKLTEGPIQLGPYGFANIQKENEIEAYLLKLKEEGNSVGGSVSVQVYNCPAGLGEPCFDKLKADLAKAMLSIGSCVSFSYGLGSEFSEIDGKVASEDSNNFGGIEGGISNGSTIHFELVFKPTSTVGENAKQGRHDPCIVPRVLPVVESMAYIVLADHFLRQNSYHSWLP